MSNTEFLDPAKALNRTLGARSRARRNARKDAVCLDSATAMKRRNDILPTLKLETRPLSSLRPATTASPIESR